MEWSTFWAAMAVFVAVCAAVFAERSAVAAESSAASALRANDIEMHRERLAIYKALLDLHYQLTRHGIGLPLEAIADYYQPSTLSEFYYPAAQYKELEGIRSEAFDLHHRHLTWQDQKQQGSAEAAKTLAELHERRKKLDKSIEAAKDDLRSRLRLDPSYSDL